MPMFDGHCSLPVGNEDGCGNPHTLRRNRQYLRQTALSLLLGAVIGFAAAPRVSATPKENQQAVHGFVRCVTLKADGESREVWTNAATVEELFAEQHLVLRENDRCSQPLTSALKDGQTLWVSRVRIQTITERTIIPFSTRRNYSADLMAGERIVKQEGKPGEKLVTYREYYRNDKRTERVHVSTKFTAPRPQIEVHGVRGLTLASRHLMAGRRVISMRASAYGPGGNGGWGMRTATGRRPGHGVVAVDPRFISLGTRLYIEGYGFAVAGDTGSAIKGDRIDLGFDSDGAASQYGRRTVRVMILD